jgi:hypothetical protein
VSWRDPTFLRALAEDFCHAFAIPGLVREWGNAGRTPKPGAQSLPQAGSPTDIDRSRHDQEHAPPGPHSVPGAAPSAAPPAPQEPVERAEPPAAVSASPEPERASALPPGTGIAPSGDNAEPGPAAAVQVPTEPENASTVPPSQPDANPGDGPAIGAEPAAADAKPPAEPTRASILAAFNRKEPLPERAAPPTMSPRPTPPQPRPTQRQAGPVEPEFSDAAWDEFCAGFRFGTLKWNTRRLGPEPFQPGCRAPKHILKRNGLA